MDRVYRGRIAPSPTGYLHIGHARTFWVARERVRMHGGELILRNEDLDTMRCKPEFIDAMVDDLRWFGFEWNEGPDCGGAYGPYQQSARLEVYRHAFDKLKSQGSIYPCICSRQDVLRSASAPHAQDEEAIYPGTCRDRTVKDFDSLALPGGEANQICWRFRVPDGATISFTDCFFGVQDYVAGRDFGDFVVWRHDGIPSYQLAVVVDDAAMLVSEVVRGADLLVSTARQILLYEALAFHPPSFYHCPLVTDENGVRLAKRHAALSLRALREAGSHPGDLRRQWIV